MAREAISERGLPSPEARRQILVHAGMILDEARELMARLDRHETTYPRTACDHRRLIWGTSERPCLRTLSSPARPALGPNQDIAQLQQADQALAT